jgi:hypothetical protein
MLVSKDYVEKDIVSFKLVNGDEIVARIAAPATSAGYIIEKPCTVVPAQGGIALIQSLFSAEINNNIELKFTHVMMHSPTTRGIADHYIQVTTGIQTVNKGGIIT